MANNGSLDSNALLRLLMRDIPEQSEAMLMLLDGGGTFEIADIAVLETLFVLNRYYKMPRVEVAAIWQALLDNPQLLLNRPVFVLAKDYYVDHAAWSIEDAFLLAHAQHTGNTPLWTFDRTLAKQSSGLAHFIN